MRFLRRLKNYFLPSQHNAYRPHLLRRRALFVLLGIALVAEGFLVANLMARNSGFSFLAAVIQSEIITLTNEERLHNNAGVLTENTTLDAAAQAKANDMAAKGYFAHQSPDGRQPWDFISAAGYRYQYAGENLAVRFVDSKDVVDAWMESPTHRANIVKPAYTQIGVAMAQGMYKGQEATFVVQYFATPLRSAAPAAAAPSAPIAVEQIEQPGVAVLGASNTAPAVQEPQAPPTSVVREEASLTQSLARQAGRLLTEPRAVTASVLGVIIALLGVALSLSFFHHIQIQARDLLLPGAVVAGVALTLLFLNSNFLSGLPAESQPAGAALYLPVQTGSEVVLPPEAASDER